MLSFAVHDSGIKAQQIDLSGAYLTGSDDVPLRAEITLKDGVIQCKKRSAGPAGLVLLWPVEGVGEVMVETVRLCEREKPYILEVELARGRLMRICQKIEDWGLLNYEGTEELSEQVGQARDLLVKALQADTAADASSQGNHALALAVQAAEGLSQFHASVFLERRRQTAGFAKRILGCGIDLDQSIDLAHKRLSEVVDFVTVPIVWRDVEPSEQTFNWKQLDTWVEALTKLHIPIKASSLLSFHERNIPDWLYIWEHDFDTIRDLAFEHARRVINRYGRYIQAWDVISGIHATNCFTFGFEQLMELTRMAAALTKQAAPRSLAIVNIIAPWGEYYARNQRTIPPLLYAEMVVQSGVNFDALGLQFCFGAAADGTHVRDMFQISSLIDAFAKPGKPLHITGVQVPSHTDAAADGKGANRPTEGGRWRGAWSEEIQAQWLDRFLEVALSKPFVETVTWHGLTDHQDHPVPYGGLLNSGLAPKQAYLRFKALRSHLHSNDADKTA